jgi:ATP-dependent DNA helicase RecG
MVKTVVSFSNTAGGVLLIGVEDGTRHVRGVADPLALEERLANLISDRIRPSVLPDLEVLPWRSTHVLAVQVHPSPVRPHHVKDLGPDQGVFVRIGSTNRRADTAMIEELRRYARNQSFDEEPMPELSSEAIDFRATSELFAQVRPLRKQDLRTLRITADHQGREVPTVGGVILFGKDRTTHFPDAWIQVGRFQGSDRRRILDTDEIRSYPPAAIEEAISFVRRNTAREIVIEGARRADRWTYPSRLSARPS